MGVLNVESYNYGALLSQVPIWKMGHESTAEINSSLSTEILGSWRTSVIGVVEVKTKPVLGKLFLLSLPGCRQRMVLFAQLVLPPKVVSKSGLQKFFLCWVLHLRRVLRDRAT